MSTWAPSPRRPCQRCVQYLDDLTANCHILTFRKNARRCWRCAKLHHACTETPPSDQLDDVLRARDRKEQADVDLLLDSSPANIEKSNKRLEQLNDAVNTLVEHLVSARSRQSAATRRSQSKASSDNAPTRASSRSFKSASIISSEHASSGAESDSDDTTSTGEAKQPSIVLGTSSGEESESDETASTAEAKQPSIVLGTSDGEESDSNDTDDTDHTKQELEIAKTPTPRISRSFRSASIISSGDTSSIAETEYEDVDRGGESG